MTDGEAVVRVTIGARGVSGEVVPVDGVLVPASLADLLGPTVGVITLPDWCESVTVDMSDRASVVAMYQSVIRYAPDDLSLIWWLDEDILKMLWPQLRLPARFRLAWETLHPELADRL